MVEISTSKDEKYRSLASKAAKHCSLSVKKTQKLRINGTKIVESDQWTLGWYAKSLKKSVGKVKLGVGYTKGTTLLKVCICIV